MTDRLSSENIKAEALRLGFSACGLAPAAAVDEPAAASFRQWITTGHHAEMHYMENNEEKRLNPRLLVKEARTVISVALNYYPSTFLPEKEYQIAWYAYGKDYHEVMKAKLMSLMHFICQSLQKKQPENIRAFCDTAPIIERYWAWRAGLGWIGKNTQLLIPHAGSCFFLGEIIIDHEADHYDSPQKSRCGSCTRCLDACPMNALEAPFKLNSKRCLSYLTIEHRGEFPSNLELKMGKNIYGCDECQRACPWNRFAHPTGITEFHPSKALLNMKKDDWHQLSEEQYKTLFKGSAVKRTKYNGLVRNVKEADDSDSFNQESH